MAEESYFTSLYKSAKDLRRRASETIMQKTGQSQKEIDNEFATLKERFLLCKQEVIHFSQDFEKQFLLTKQWTEGNSNTAMLGAAYFTPKEEYGEDAYPLSVAFSDVKETHMDFHWNVRRHMNKWVL